MQINHRFTYLESDWKQTADIKELFEAEINGR